MNSFLQGKKTLDVAPLRAPVATARPVGLPSIASSSRGQSCTAGAAGQPSVEVVKEGDKVVRLIVNCSCGERVEIECLYPVGR